MVHQLVEAQRVRKPSPLALALLKTAEKGCFWNDLDKAAGEWKSLWSVNNYLYLLGDWHPAGKGWMTRFGGVKGKRHIYQTTEKGMEILKQYGYL